MSTTFHFGALYTQLAYKLKSETETSSHALAARYKLAFKQSVLHNISGMPSLIEGVA